ncbi:MAG: hypothetical protein MHM6MM_001511 [Cercozoa sp. M6MM]
MTREPADEHRVDIGDSELEQIFRECGGEEAVKLAPFFIAAGVGELCFLLSLRTREEWEAVFDAVDEECDKANFPVANRVLKIKIRAKFARLSVTEVEEKRPVKSPIQRKRRHKGHARRRRRSRTEKQPKESEDFEEGTVKVQQEHFRSDEAPLQSAQNAELAAHRLRDSARIVCCESLEVALGRFQWPRWLALALFSTLCVGLPLWAVWQQQHPRDGAWNLVLLVFVCAFTLSVLCSMVQLAKRHLQLSHLRLFCGDCQIECDDCKRVIHHSLLLRVLLLPFRLVWYIVSLQWLLQFLEESLEERD